MRGALHRAWHSPRTGPVMLVLAGLPVLLLVACMLVFPVLAVGELWSLARVPGYVPFPQTPRLVLAVILLAWIAAIALGLRLRATARANAGLDVSFTLRQRGRAVGAQALAKRLAAAMAAPDLAIGDVIREDSGAGAWIETPTERFWLSVAAPEEGETVIGLAYDSGPDLRRRLSHRADRALFARLEAALRGAIAADPALEPVAPSP